MRRRLPALPLLAVFALPVLPGCQPTEGPAPGPEAEVRHQLGEEALDALRPQEDGTIAVGTHPTCEARPARSPSAATHIIRMAGGNPQVRPHPLVQPPGPVGMIGWHSPTHHWRITYTNGSPLPRSVYEGVRGERVVAFVRPDAECREYAYEVEIWTDGDTLSRDYPARDTVNGDEIEPYRF